jgi:AcrR family transcriptional regulator
VIKRPNLLAGEDLPPEPTQKRSLEKRRRLKAAALALFGEKGYEGASIEEIVQRAGLAAGGFYLHYRSKRQLLLALMDELLETMSQLELRPSGAWDVRSGLRQVLARGLAGDLKYLGAYRAFREAALSDPGLARKQAKIHAWTTARVAGVLQLLEQLPGARQGVDTRTLASALDSLFWALLAQVTRMNRAERQRWVDTATHLVYHAMFHD